MEQKYVDAIENVILKHEGGFVNHRADKGGATNYGITHSTLSSWYRRPVTIDDVRKLTRETAIEIYYHQYLKQPKIDKLPDPIWLQVFDIGVNSGPKRGIQMLQQVLNDAGFGPVDIDGIIGPQTIDATENALEEMGPYLTNAIVEERIKFYENIVEGNPSQSVFLKGWLNRANSFRVPTGKEKPSIPSNQQEWFKKLPSKLKWLIEGLFDENEGHEVIKQVQSAYNYYEERKGPSLAVDGILGPNTVGRINEEYDMDQRCFHNHIIDHIIKDYKKQLNDDASKVTFIKRMEDILNKYKI